MQRHNPDGNNLVNCEIFKYVMISKEKAYLEIQELVNRFDEQIESYKQTDYNETLTRRDFIDPFFKALGWDVDNSQGYAEAYREVIHEDKVRVGKATKAPDYSFRLPGGKRLFFVEAKKPNIDIKNNISVAYQIRRYGWSAKLPVSIITDFEEFAVYDCTKKPKPTDKSGIARIKYIKFREYLKEFDYLWDTFSKERVLKGSFDRYIKSDTVKKGTATVDKDFLASLDNWRTYLATSISRRNKELDEDEINYAVQLTIDRLIFLRIAEDRGVEQYGQLKTSVTQKGDAYQNLFSNFRKADEKYNSGLFDFRKDVISETLKIDNKVIKTIVNEMYYPESPYEFSVISVEILGSAYEQFLGKVIRITPAHQAKIEEKPEVRKAGGVYYTPQYVVDYIVKNTVGKLIDGKTPKQIEKIKICDPACGSGSFLIGAYQYLLDHYKNYYYSFFEKYSKDAANNKLTQFDRNKAIRERNKLPLTPDGELDSHLRKEILLNHIFGVDIDTNAVEVTKLSLLLKCMEGITVASIQKLDFKERVLPTLENNIKSGNSLVDIDFYNGELDLWEKKVKPFNWQKAFPDVFKIRKSTENRDFRIQFQKVKNLLDDTDKLLKKYTLDEPEGKYKINGGFDIVIGNPPYGASITKDMDIYLRNKYQVANYQLDTYNLFFERGKKLLSTGGYLGFIVPSAWVASKYDNKLRRYLIEETNIENFVIAPKHTFKDANVETCIVIISNEKPSRSFIVERWDMENKRVYFVNTNEIKFENNYIFPVYSDNKTNQLVHKLRNQKFKLDDFAEVVWGVKIYENGKGKPPQKPNESKLKTFHSDKKIKDSHRPLIGGGEIKRYKLDWKGGFVDYGEWLAAPRQPHWFDGERILVREVTAKGVIQATYVDGDYVFSNSVDGIKIKSDEISIKYVLGLINSRLISFFHLNTSANAFKGTFPKVLLHDLRNLPLPNAEMEIQMEIEGLVNTLLQLNSEKTNARLPSKIQQIDSMIDYCENKINQLVYQLYELTEEEIKIVEESV
jgi:type I restriction-modification system DNA methylase subunit